MEKYSRSFHRWFCISIGVWGGLALPLILLRLLQVGEGKGMGPGLFCAAMTLGGLAGMWIASQLRKELSERGPLMGSMMGIFVASGLYGFVPLAINKHAAIPNSLIYAIAGIMLGTALIGMVLFRVVYKRAAA